MVFEGILVSVLNRFLGPYVKNLDPSQLKVGIFGGDVVLEKLELKENALDDLNLPVRVFAGYLGCLRLKIPWKSLYSSPIVAVVDGLYVLVGPASAGKYDAARDARETKEAKDKQLKKVEEARKKAEQKDVKKEDESSPGLVQKLATQFLRNIQVTVKNIHVRYEDAVTNPAHPFSCGVTLDSLFVQSTDSGYVVGGTAASTASDLIYKLVQLNCLALYWNSGARLFGPDPPADWVESLIALIARPDSKPHADTQYVLHPITAEVRLQLSLTPDVSCNTPQALANLLLRAVDISLDKQQYRDVMSLIGSLDRMTINKKFLRYKPLLPVLEDRQGWWRYAITAVLEEDVKRRTQMWSWKHIKEHRRLCKNYTELYVEKLLSKSVPANLNSQLDALEVKLDVFNITVCRQLAENKAQRKKAELQAESEGGGWWGWATGWGGAAETTSTTTEYTPPTEEELSREREKLYQAVGYSDTASAASYPKEYVANQLQFELKRVTLQLSNENGTVAELSTHQVSATLKQRPGQGNISVTTSISSLLMTGAPSSRRTAPEMLTSNTHGSEPLLSVEFDLKPFDSEVDQRIKATLLPIQVVYDAETVDAIIGMFLLPRDVHLHKLSAAAASTLEELKTQTRAGLEHAVSKRKLLEVDISLQSPYLIVPENGVMNESATVLVVDLGHLRVTSDLKFNVPSVREASMEELQEAFYDHYNLCLSAVEVLVVSGGVAWEGARGSQVSPLHLLRPTQLQLQLMKSLLPNDTKLPTVKVQGELPSLILSLSDKKLKQVLQIVQSIPLPPPSLTARPEPSKYSYDGLDEAPALAPEGIAGSLPTPAFEEDEEEEEEEGEVDSEGDVWFTASECEYEAEEEGSLVVISKRTKRKGKRSRDAGSGMAEEEEAGSDQVTGSEKTGIKLQLNFNIQQVGITFSEHHEEWETSSRPPLLDLGAPSDASALNIGPSSTHTPAPLALGPGLPPVSGELELGPRGEGISVGPCDVPRLQLEVRSISATVLQRSWDLSVASSVASLSIYDYYCKDALGKPDTLMEKDYSEDEKFLSVKYCKNDREGPQYTSLCQSTQQTISVAMSLIRLRLHRESLANLVSTAKAIASVLKKKGEKEKEEEDVAAQEGAGKAEEGEGSVALETEVAGSQVTVPGERALHLEARLGGVALTLCDSLGDLLTTTITGLKTGVEMFEGRIEITASMADIVLVDPTSTGCHSKVVCRSGVHEAQNIISTEVVVYQKASGASAAAVDMEGCDLSVKADIQRVQVTLLLAFVGRVKNYATKLLTQLKLDQKTIDSAKEAAAKTASRTAEALKEQSSSRVRLEVTVQAPVLVLPLSASSRSALLADLGELRVTNSFLLASDAYSSMKLPSNAFLSATDQPAIVDCMDINISSIQLRRVADLEGEGAAIGDHVILEPLAFSGQVIRRLSSWCIAVPAIAVKANLKALEVNFSPVVYLTVMNLVESVKKELADSSTEKDVDGGAGGEGPAKEASAEGQLAGSEEGGAEEGSGICVKATVGRVKLLLHSEDDPLATITLQGLSADVELLADQVQVAAGIKDIGLTDLSDTQYSKIISVAEGASALKAQVGLFPNATKGGGALDMSKSDLSVRVELGHFRILALFLFVNRVLNFAKQFNVSRKAIESAKKSAQESATAAVSAVQEQHKSGQRLKLDVILNAPEVIVPLESQSKEVVVVDLGTLTLSNTFHLTRPEAEQDPALYEQYAIKLTQLQVFRSLWDGTKIVSWKRSVLDPFNLDLDMKRNLSASWYRGMPTIALSAQLGTLKMVASGDDIEMVCGILNGNVKEGKAEEDGDVEEPETAKEEDSNEQDVSGETAAVTGSTEDEPSTTLSLIASLESIEIELYEKAKLLDATDSSVWPRQPRHALARLTLLSFQATSRVMSNGALDATVKMTNCLLDDLRPNKKISRLIEKISEVAATEIPLIDFAYSMTENKSMNVKAKIDGVQVLVDLHFILMLLNFLKESVKPITATNKLEMTDSDSGAASVAKKPKVEPESKLQDVPASSSKILISAVIARPRIALLEDATQANSRALLLETQVTFDLLQTRGMNNMSASIRNFSITSTRVNTLQDNSLKVLTTDKDITASMDSLSSATTIKAVVPKIAIVLSPTTVRLILHVVKTLTPEQSDEDKTGETAPAGLWNPATLDHSKWYLQPPISAVDEEGSSVDTTAPQATSSTGSSKPEFLDLLLEELSVSVERELPSGETAPVIAMAMGKYGTKALWLSMQEWSGKFQANAQLCVEASYYNLSHDAWEPLLEPIIDPQNESSYTSWSLTAKVARHVDIDPAVLAATKVEDLPPELDIEIASKHALQLTVSKTSLGLFKELSDTYMGDGRSLVGVEEEGRDEVDYTAPETRKPAFMLTNKLGTDYPIRVRGKDTVKVHGAFESTVRQGERVPLQPLVDSHQLKPGEFLPRDSHLQRVHIVQLQIAGFKPLDVALGTSESVYYPLLPDKPQASPSRDQQPPRLGLVVDIDRKASGLTPLVTFRSPLQVVNHLEAPLTVLWMDDDDGYPASVAEVGVGQSEPLPLKCAAQGSIYIQPMVEGSEPTKDPVEWSTPGKASVDVSCYAFSAETKQKEKFFMRVVIKEEEYSKRPPTTLTPSHPHHLLHIHYPITVENLLPLAVAVGPPAGKLWPLSPGQRAHFSHAALASDTPVLFQLKMHYSSADWQAELSADTSGGEVQSVRFSCGKDSRQVVAVSCQRKERGAWHLTLFSPSWMVNKTGLTLEYTNKAKDDVITHRESEDIAFFQYQNACVRVVGETGPTEWSKPFSVEAVGSEGVFQCQESGSGLQFQTRPNREYQMGTRVQLSQFGLSKIITISPLFMAYNKTRDQISFKEEKSGEILSVPSKQLLPFWPACSADRMLVAVNDPAMTNSSVPFKFTETTSLLLETNNEIPAVVVDIQVTGSANIVMFLPYYEGSVPMQLINDTDFTVAFNQESRKEGGHVLMAGQSVMYSWDSPSAPRAISWHLLQHRKLKGMKNIVAKDGCGEFKLVPVGTSTASQSSTRSSISSVQSEGWEGSEEGGESVDGEEEEAASLWELVEKDEAQISEEEDDPGVATAAPQPEAEAAGEEGGEHTDFSFFKQIVKVGRTAKKAKKRLSASIFSGGKNKPSSGYWISFLDGLQRVVLFTTNAALKGHIDSVVGGNKSERTTTSVSLSLKALGLSLVNDSKGKEVAYIGIPQSSIIWETVKRWNRWKPVSNEISAKLEQLYLVRTADKQSGGGPVEVSDSGWKVDFDSMMLIDKQNVEKKLRRSHFEGLFAEVALSKHHTAIQARINSIQVDSQLPFAPNPTIFYPYPTPPAIASKFEPKPFIESSIIIRNTEQSSVNEIELLQVLVQELGVKVDMSFIMAILELLADLPTTASEVELIEADIKSTRLPLEKSKVAQVSAAATRNYLKFLHLSPLQIHLSFSLEQSNSVDAEQKVSTWNPVFGAVISVLSQFAKLVGRTEDAELKLGYFQLEEVALTQSDLKDRVIKHYIQQAALQVYSIFLGLEVLGNPVGFVKGLKDGAIGLFYQPIQGAVLGPGEFFQGLSLGGRQFLGGTVGGLSGSVGKISGVLGDTVAKLTFDKDFQANRKRSSTSGSRSGSRSVGQGLEGAAKGFFSGVTGVFTQPIRGVKEEGIAGLFKGTGRGVVGLLLRPTSGLLDLTSATLNAIQRKTQVGESEVNQLRSVRYIGTEKIIYPYSPHKSEGYGLFLAYDNGQLVGCENYFDHLELTMDPLRVLLITDSRFAVIKRNEVLDKWDAGFEVQFKDMIGDVAVQSNVINIPVLESGGLRFLSRKPREVTKELTVDSAELADKASSLITQSYLEYKTTKSLAGIY